MSKEGNITVDVGNSSIKVGRFVDDELIERRFYNTLEELRSLDNTSNFSWIFSSVGYQYEEIRSYFEEVNPLLLTYTTPLPIQLDYQTPQTLGVDRLSAAVGANFLYPSRNVLILDAGTCITYDVVNSQGIFQGGVIAPGLSMRMKAMHQFTQRLPDITTEWKDLEERSAGKTTRECMLNGSLTAIIHEMNGFIHHFSQEYDHLVVVITGGDAGYFESRLKPHIFADSNLLLKGLNRILNYNK